MKLHNIYVLFLILILPLSACSESPVAPDLDDEFRARTANQELHSLASQDPGLFAAKNGKSKVNVCHVDEEGQINLISISSNALNAHFRHGDAQPVTNTGPLSTAGATFSASSIWNASYSADLAFDGDPLTNWNAGTRPFTPSWVEITFPTPQKFDVITGLLAQSPAGVTVHEVSFDGSPAFTWAGSTSHLDLLTETFATLQTAQTIRVTTTANPSWVSWFELQFLATTTGC